MNERLIVIEGIDGSGKATQSELLVKTLGQKGIPAKGISFPDYSHASSTLVKMYLRGDFGASPQSVNAYAASSFYAVDRYASYQQYWKQAYWDGTIIVADRYTTSNAVHQMAKLERTEWEEYLTWLYDYEFNRLCIPKPNLVLYLDVPPQTAFKLIERRYQGDERRKDLHEKDLEYLQLCRQAALFAAQRMDWKIISCMQADDMLSIEQIQNKIQAYL